MSNTQETVKINEKYKDRIFCLLFGREEYKENILSLYNALNDSHYDNVDDIEITTIEDALYIKMKNDVSFLVDSYLTLWEQQSTFNPNMPVRGLMYYGNLYNSYIHERALSIYGSKLIKLPTPKYVVFYNGTTNRDAIEKLRLSDAFMQEDADHEFEWTATMINLNTGKNEELLAKCKVLSDYMVLINKIRVYKKEMDNIKAATNRAVSECIKAGVLVEFLEKHRGEIMANILTEFDEEAFVKCMKAEGREEGRQENKIENAINLLDILTDEDIAKRIKLPLETVQQLRKENS